MAVGTLAWSRRTGGKLNLREKLSMVSQLVVAQLRVQFGRTSASSTQLRRLDLDAIQIPDSTVAQEAMNLCEAVSPLSLYYHCMRTYFLGGLFAQVDRVKYDTELFFVTAMLHDLGLTDAYNGKDPTAHCYAVEGGRAAAQFVSDHHWDAERRDRLNEAIALHLNVSVAADGGGEAHLVNRAAALDVIGLNIDKIPPEALALVLERYPRANFKQQLSALMQKQLKERPHSRVALLYQFAQFDQRIRNAPFES